MGQGEFEFRGTSVRIAGDPTFIPNLADPTKNHTIATGMVNRGKHPRTGADMTEEITLHFWNKGASMAANFLPKGKQCNVNGHIRSHVTDTGQVRADGKKILNRDISIVVSRCELLADSRREMEAAFNQGIANMKAAGRLPANVVLTLDEVLPKKEKMVDFNPQLAAQTGKYGHAKVWSKDRGMWNAATAPVQAVATAAIPDQATVIAQMQAQLAKLSGGVAATVVADPVVVAPVTNAAAPVVDAAAVVTSAVPDPFEGQQ